MQAPECNIEICSKLKTWWPSVRRVQLPPMPFSAAALLAAEMRRVCGRTVVVICESQRAADEFQANLEAFLEETPLLINLPPDESAAEWADGLPTAGARCQALFRLALVDAPVAVVTCVQAMMQTVPARARLLEQSLKITLNGRHDPGDLSVRLAEYGYAFTGEVHEPGQAARRGGLLDVWPPGMDWPCRLEFFGDQVETMRWFDPATQRSRDATAELLIMPVRRDNPATAGGLVTPVAHLPENAIYFWFESAAAAGGLEAHAEMLLAADPTAREQGALVTLDALRALVRSGAGTRECFAGNLEAAPDAVPLDLGFRALAVPAGVSADSAAPDVFEARRRAWLEELTESTGPGRQVRLLFGTEGARQRFRELYPRLPFDLCLGRITDGFQNDALGLVVVAEANLIGRRKWAGPAGRRPRSAPAASAPLTDVMQIDPGDLVVHLEHGIGRYQGLCEIEFDGKRQEALAVEYADNAKLYVPVTHAHLLSRYVGSGGHTATLHRLGGLRWKREKRNAETAVRDLAASMLETQALRNARTGFAFPEDNLWQYEFEAAFPYQETEDQERAVAEVRRDMQSNRPMDRLICGDAGYGKTEVAMRAAFRCVMAGRQAALLVPTTVLAQQHFECFRERMADYPVRVEMLCRFQTGATTARILRDLREGRVDIIIGTHRLVQADVGFNDLGLVIIDEEQRFGVAHKERLKQLKQLVDVLTMTATPIPRTLYLSLAGAREISVIQTPPRERRPIETVVTRADDGVIREVVLRELNRGGQLFYVYNRVMTIHAMADRLRRLVPEARMGIGHGQMPGGELERVMHGFAQGRFDILLCTTIIESGLDIPNANTILIDRADRFGVAELYQLRGRVGRSNRKAYACLLLPARGSLPEDARRRLSAIMEHSGAGAGFRLALRDLEIRGAGNLLGAAQSGHIAAVGFELYCQLLRHAVARLRGDAAPLPRLINVEINLDFIEYAPLAATADTAVYLPVDYIDDERLRLEFFRRLASLTDFAALDELRADTLDRFGLMPAPVERLFQVAHLRLKAAMVGIESVIVREGRVMLRRNGEYLQHNHQFPRLRGQGADARLRELLELLP